MAYILRSENLQDRMLTYGNNVYTYTLNGSLLTKTRTLSGAEMPLVTEYSYDAMGNLLRVVLPDNRVITYQIDARGRRIGKSIDGVFQYGFIYQDQLNPIAKVDESGNILEQYVYGMKSNVPEYLIKGGIKYHIISDHLGSPLAVWQEGERTSPVLERKYDSFGNILEENGSFELIFGFAGGVWDVDTGLVRFGVRDYDGETGRWTSKEPLGFAGARNFYVYAGSDPVNLIDLTGLKPGDCFSTADLAAIDALEYIYDQSISLGKEMGGGIYQKGFCYYASEATIGTYNDVDIILESKNPLIAWYHSHPEWITNGSLLLSDGTGDGDLFESNKNNIDAYLINYLGDISKYDVNYSITFKIGQINIGMPDSFYKKNVLSYGNEVRYDK